jgi:DNA-binding transcriptional regulator YiaG
MKSANHNDESEAKQSSGLNLITEDFEESPSTPRPSLRAGSETDQLAIDFRVALALDEYGFGAMYTSKHLLRSRGMVQSWKKMGEKHHLARKDYNKDQVRTRLWKIRRVTTFKDLDFHVARALFDYHMSSSYISKALNIPVSTVINWRNGNSPASIKNNFVDNELIRSKLDAVLGKIKREITTKNLDYFLTLKINEESHKALDGGRVRGIGARNISWMLRDLSGSQQIPERTVASWIKQERRPRNYDQKLVDEEFLDQKFTELVLMLTKQHINYHLAKALNKIGWTYSAIALFLGVQKEKVRGWIRKGRGSPVAKAFFDPIYVQRVLRTMLVTAYGSDSAIATTETPEGQTEKKDHTLKKNHIIV